mmetsp:Transcript_9256/g.16783  ORF Transcript_9256/g.16783 Transcript_9256/m.16783 type:complete len:133 (-) Transcript_9256:62-460(-)
MPNSLVVLFSDDCSSTVLLALCETSVSLCSASRFFSVFVSASDEKGQKRDDEDDVNFGGDDDSSLLLLEEALPINGSGGKNDPGNAYADIITLKFFSFLSLHNLFSSFALKLLWFYVGEGEAARKNLMGGIQ